MSISAFIPGAQTEEEHRFYVPVATETFFATYWQPAAGELKLQWVPLFSTGVDIEAVDLPDVLRELVRLKQWGQEQVPSDQRDQLLSRIELLETELPRILEQGDCVIFIG
ncbi:hypothetical protein ACFQZE_18330 [Paenibacillus sp. GCM10027627]|uniref:hypothetical protein n=1 Tax=unclassified Paenibacillus TaxID=185978 RepID=UPI00363E0D52